MSLENGNASILPLRDGCLFVSPSFLEIACPTAQAYYKILGRVSAEGGSARQFGKHMHSALSVYYTTSEADRRAAAQAELASRFEKEPVNDPFRTAPWAATLFDQYALRFPEEDWRVVTLPSGRPASEVKVARPLGTVLGIPVWFHGIIDLIVEQNGLLYIVDFKTTSRLGASFWDAQRVAAAPRGYAWAIAPLFSQKVDGHIVRAIRTNQPPKSHETKTPGEQRKWWDECFGDDLTCFAEGELEEWRENALLRVKAFIQQAQDNAFPMLRSQCVGKFGRCDYYDVCSSFPVSSRERILATDAFTNKTNPMESYEQEEN